MSRLDLRLSRLAEFLYGALSWGIVLRCVIAAGFAILGASATRGGSTDGVNLAARHVSSCLRLAVRFRRQVRRVQLVRANYPAARIDDGQAFIHEEHLVRK